MTNFVTGILAAICLIPRPCAVNVAVTTGRHDSNIKKQSHAGLIGQQIVPQPVLIAPVSLAKINNKPALADSKKPA
jgi:hypothetical protein